MYLGMPKKICGSKKQVFSVVQERMNGRINLWSAKLLSKVGKEVQIKSVTQAVPTYVSYLVISCLKILVRNCPSQWHVSGGARVTITKVFIGWHEIRSVFLWMREVLVFGTNDFNLALLEKQVWRLLIFPDSLIVRVLKGRYYRHSNPMVTGKANNPSYG